jgi:hypothetical protein
MAILAHGLISRKSKSMTPSSQSNAADERKLRHFSNLPETVATSCQLVALNACDKQAACRYEKRGEGGIASTEITASAQADGELFPGLHSCFLRPMRGKSLQKKPAPGEILADSQKHDGQEAKTLRSSSPGRHAIDAGPARRIDLLFRRRGQLRVAFRIG